MKAALEKPVAAESRPSQVELWLLNPEQISDLASLAQDILPETERGNDLRRKSEGLWRHWAGRQVALRLALATYASQKPENLVLSRDARGKPELSGRLDLRFSVSACEGWWLGAFSDEDVGVDLERVRANPDLWTVAQTYFSKTELAGLEAAADEQDRLNFFYRCWTRKEAVLKLKGQGLAGLAALRVSAPTVWVEDLHLQAGLAASLALRRPPTWVRRREQSALKMPRTLRKSALRDALESSSAERGLTRRGTDMPSEIKKNKPATAYSIAELGMQEIERLEKQSYLWLHMELPAILETLPRGGRFVDLGSGTGLQADAVSKACPDAQVYGFDADPLAVEQSRKNFGGRDGLHFDLRRMEQGPPPGFPLADVAMLRFVLMHLPGAEKALMAARAWLKPGGILHVFESDDRRIELEPTPDWLPALQDLMQAVQTKRGGDRHLGLELPSLLASTGWDVVGQRHFALDPTITAAAVPKVFLPVAEFYLASAECHEFIGPQALDELKQGIAQVKNGSWIFTRANIPVFHVWGQAPMAAKL